MWITEKPQPRGAVVVAAGGFAAVAAYAIAGALQILVWNPLAAVPGATLGQIRAEMARADESLTANLVLTWGAIGIVLATVVLLVAIVRMNSRIGPVLTAYLVLLVFAAPGHIFVGFGPSMSLSDTFLVSGGDHAPWGIALYVVSAAALLALIVLIIRTGRSATARIMMHG
jgi:hypothetical protein